MDLLIVVFAAATGYFLGSISFARVILKLVAPEKELSGIKMDLVGTDEKFEVTAISGTAVSMKLGPKWGGLTAILDILKVALPALAFRLGYRDVPYHLIVSAMGIIGHNWPIYYRFKGGRGLSPTYGGFLVLDWLGTLITAFVGMFVGMFVLKQVVISYMLGLWLMIPWIWFRTHDVAQLAYVVFACVMFVVAMIPDIKKILEYKRRGLSGDFSQSMDATPMGRSIKEIANRFGAMKDE